MTEETPDMNPAQMSATYTRGLQFVKKDVTCGPNEYLCGVCNTIYQKGWSDAEALEEYHHKYKEEISLTTGTVILCDDCHKKMQP